MQRIIRYQKSGISRNKWAAVVFLMDMDMDMDMDLADGLLR